MNILMRAAIIMTLVIPKVHGHETSRAYKSKAYIIKSSSLLSLEARGNREIRIWYRRTEVIPYQL